MSAVAEQIIIPDAQEFVKNPVHPTIGVGCELYNTKKQSYYNHTYNPQKYLDKLRELGISADVLSRFDNTPRTNCCNAISIMLYMEKQHNYYNYSKLIFYLYCIYATIKNTERKMPDWIVRLYLDSSIYLSIQDLAKSETYVPYAFERQEVIDIFNIINSSKNVEIYMYNCSDDASNDSSNDGFINKNYYRILRFLILVDPTVNICAIREADGFLNNLECHNLNMFANSDRLFYLPQFMTTELINNEFKYIYIGKSYQYWLELYKLVIQNDFFSNHLNIYDLLAGTFTTKLKLKKEFYDRKSKEIYDSIQFIKKASLEEIKRRFIRPDLLHKPRQIVLSENRIHGEFYLADYANLNNYIDSEFFNIARKDIGFAFDELLLLELYKEIISVSFNPEEKTADTRFLVFNDEVKRNVAKLNELFSGANIKTIEINMKKKGENTYNFITEKLKTELVISGDFQLKEEYITKSITTGIDKGDEIYRIDANILNNIQIKEPIDIYINNKSMLAPLNINNKIYLTKRTYDSLYGSQTGGYKEKYLKYKAKYLKLKNSMNL